MLTKIRAQFGEEWVWRMFIVLQIAGIIGIVYLDVTNSSWQFLPDFTDYRGRFKLNMHLFEGRYYTTYKNNWHTLALLFGPFVVSKGIDWITSAKNEGSSKNRH